MNNDLQKMIVGAECRHLTESEMDRVRDYASGMSTRLQTMRVLQGAETEIVEQACSRFTAGQRAYVAQVRDASTKLARDMRLTLRYVAQAYVRQDVHFFRKNYAEWIGELLKSLVPAEVLVFGQECLRDSLKEHLDSADANALSPYLEVFIDELRA